MGDPHGIVIINPEGSCLSSNLLPLKGEMDLANRHAMFREYFMNRL